MNDVETTTTMPEVAQDTAPAPTLELIQTKLDFYIGNWRNDTLEIGHWLTEAKKAVPHGGWVEWVENRYGMNKRTAQRFMAVYDRFGKTTTSSLLSSSQMLELLALPADETEQFIEAKAAEGNPVEDMTVKQLREKVQQWKSRAEVNENALKESQREAEQALQKVSKIAQDYKAIQSAKALVERKLDAAQNQLRNQKPIIQPPADYEQTKRELAKLRDEKNALQKKLNDARTAEIPADYHTNKKRLTELDAKIAEMQKQIDAQISAEDYGNVAHKLDTILSLINDVLNSKNAGRVIADYERNNPDRYHMILAQFGTFLEIMK